MVAHSIAQIHVFVITRVMNGNYLLSGTICFRFITTNQQQRSDHFADHRQNACQTMTSGAAYKTHKQGLRLIISRMSGGDTCRAHLTRHLIEKTVAFQTRQLLQRLAGDAEICLHAPYHCGYPPTTGYLLYVFALFDGFRPQAMVDINGSQSKIIVGLHSNKHP